MLEDMLRQILRQARSIAIVGAKDKPGQAVDAVGRYLMDAGYAIRPVHPARRTVWGLPAWKDLSCLPEPVDVINLFRASAYCPAHAREVLALSWKPKLFWMQSGIRSPEAGSLLAAAGIPVVEDACIMVEHRRLLGERA